MNQFFKFLFASCLGTALALFLLFWIGVGWITSLAGSATSKEKVQIEENSVLELDFKKQIPEKTNNLSMDPFDVEQEDILGLQDILSAIKKAKEDPDIKGIFINGSEISAGKATASAIRAAIADFKTANKFVVAYAHYYTQGGYYLASVADSILINPVGGVDFRGYASMIAFYKGMLDKLDIKMRIFYAGKFKSATEPFRFDKMSDENKLQVRAYLNTLYDNTVQEIALSRHLTEAQVRTIAENYDGRSAESALKAHLVDRIAHEDEVYALLRQNIGLKAKDKINRISVEDYFNNRAKKLDLSTKDKIAVVYAEGTITDGAERQAGNITDGEFVKILRKIRKDEHVRAVVLRVNSPGGSVLASENIFREVMLCKAEGKPVVVSMGDVAASGGYYIACQADSIFAEANTITGSIGVFGMIPILQNTMKNKLGITYDTVRTSKYAAFGSPFIDFSDAEGKMIQDRIDETYQNFLEKVATGRKKTPEQINEIAQGRIWAGSTAKSIGLVDDIGGLDRAIKAAAQLAHLDKFRTTDFPRTQTGIEQFIEKITRKKDRDDYVRTHMLQSELDDLYPMYKTLHDIRQNSGIQMRMPYELMIR
ncbi:MAG: signal peptide peptidase SppA [Bacteroidetes bacterium]|nr:signal peptide peptidase SppA [Bacteroidota bacterium]